MISTLSEHKHIDGLLIYRGHVHMSSSIRVINQSITVKSRQLKVGWCVDPVSGTLHMIDISNILNKEQHNDILYRS